MRRKTDMNKDIAALSGCAQGEWWQIWHARSGTFWGMVQGTAEQAKVKVRAEHPKISGFVLKPQPKWRPPKPTKVPQCKFP